MLRFATASNRFLFHRSCASTWWLRISNDKTATRTSTKHRFNNQNNNFARASRAVTASLRSWKCLISSRFIERRSVTSRYHGSTISEWQQNQRRLPQQGERKNNMFILTNNNFARASRYFVHFFAVVAAYDMKLLNFTSPLYGVGEHNTKIVAFFF